jgi:hypothetical protein
MTIEDIQNFAQKEKDKASPRTDGITNVVPLYGVNPPNPLSTSQSPPDMNLTPGQYLDPWTKQQVDLDHTSYHAGNNHGSHVIPPITPMVQGDQFRDISPLGHSDSIPTTLSGNTPSSDSSSSNTRQFPFRQSESSSRKESAPSQNTWLPEGTPNFFTATPDWTMTQDELHNLENQQIITDPNAYLDDAIWNHDPAQS